MLLDGISGSEWAFKWGLEQLALGDPLPFRHLHSGFCNGELPSPNETESGGKLESVRAKVKERKLTETERYLEGENVKESKRRARQTHIWRERACMCKCLGGQLITKRIGKQCPDFVCVCVCWHCLEREPGRQSQRNKIKARRGGTAPSFRRAQLGLRVCKPTFSLVSNRGWSRTSPPRAVIIPAGLLSCY